MGGGIGLASTSKRPIKARNRQRKSPTHPSFAGSVQSRGGKPRRLLTINSKELW